MARVSITTRLNEREIDASVRHHVARAVRRAQRRTRDRAKAELTNAGRVDTGRLRNSIVSEVVEPAGLVLRGKVVADADYSYFVHQGTGVYGPRGRPIVPRRARVLRWRPRGSAAFVFRPEARGVEPTPFLQRAKERVRPSDYLP